MSACEPDKLNELLYNYSMDYYTFIKKDNLSMYLLTWELFMVYEEKNVWPPF